MFNLKRSTKLEKRIDDHEYRADTFSKLLVRQCDRIDALEKSNGFDLRDCDEKQPDPVNPRRAALLVNTTGQCNTFFGSNRPVNIPVQAVLEAILDKLDVTISYTGEGKVEAKVDLKSRGEENG